MIEDGDLRTKKVRRLLDEITNEKDLDKIDEYECEKIYEYLIEKTENFLTSGNEYGTDENDYQDELKYLIYKLMEVGNYSSYEIDCMFTRIDAKKYFKEIDKIECKIHSIINYEMDYDYDIEWKEDKDGILQLSKDSIKTINSETDEVENEAEKAEEELKKLEKERDQYSVHDFENNPELYRIFEEKIENKRKYFNSIYQKKESFCELKDLITIRKNYYRFITEAIEKFKGTKKRELEKEYIVEEYVKEKIYNNKILKEKMSKYKIKIQKLKEELIEDIKYKYLNKQKIEKKEQRKDLYLKSLDNIKDFSKKAMPVVGKGALGAGGFALGFIASKHPGIGWIRMGIAGTKLGISATNKIVNICTDKFPDNAVVQKITTIKQKNITKKEELTNKIKNSKFATEHPNAIDNMTKIKNGIKKIIKSPYTQWFVNGFSAGYIVGNIYHDVLSDAKDIANETTKDKTSDIIDKEIPTDDTIIDDSNVVTNTEEVIKPTLINDGSQDLSFEIGDTIDVSDIEYGYVSSTSDNPVHLLNEYGENVKVVRVVEVGDELMADVRNAVTGEPFAWIKLDNIEEVTGKTLKLSKKI